MMANQRHSKTIKITAKGGKVFVDCKQAKSKARPRMMIKQDITKGEFLTNLEKACQPISKESKSDSEKIETQEFHLYGGNNGMNTRLRKFVDIRG